MQSQLASKVERVLADFVEAARGAFGDRMTSIVLFGSAAEGRLRLASDVNIILVLTEFAQSDAERLAQSLALARAAVNLRPMFLLASEIPAAAECFAQKFADIARRRRVLCGPDPFAGLVVPRAAVISRLRQVLLNMTMRVRESYAERAGRGDQVARLAAETAGTLRTCASALLELETGVYHAPKEALTLIVQSAGRAEWAEALAQISAIREGTAVAPASASATVAAILEMSAHLRERAEKLK
ncbi:MAG TPA: nucleotidyltransferase domain-containing protein [Candidatus Solibacter sp.]|nr:nucleotidyltransferase domain-containing protein [Candidatus Solibacter sp.]